MARVDLQDPMIASEETIARSDHSPENERKNDQDHKGNNPFYKHAELVWLQNNSFHERKKTTKGNSDSAIVNPGSNSNSQRVSVVLKSQASIIGLPKTQKTCYMNARNPRSRKTDNIRFFPKRAGHSGKSGSAPFEPASPKVSCTGRVRSKRDRDRREKNRHSSSDAANGEEKSVEKPSNGLLNSFRRMFQKGQRRRPVEELRNAHAPSVEWPPRISKENAAPGLSGVARFASGRRSDIWEI